MTKHAWRLPVNADLTTARIINGVVVFETHGEEVGPTYTITHGDDTLHIDPVTQRVVVNDVDRTLAALPYRVLLEFAREPEGCLSAKYLYTTVWGGSFDTIKTRAVDFVVYRVRKELPKGWLQSRRNLGWRLLP